MAMIPGRKVIFNYWAVAKVLTGWEASDPTGSSVDSTDG
jgi:hypothetical protein